MPRANRHFIPGHVWHIAHRCHKKEFLLKFSRDRSRWVDWLSDSIQSKKLLNREVYFSEAIAVGSPE